VITTEASLFYRFSVAMLIGLHREYTADQYGFRDHRSAMFAGLRTFSLMASAGAAGGWFFLGP
jgi:hypothetical protein